LNPAKTLAYIVNANNGSVSACPITTAGVLGACTLAAPVNTVPPQAFGITLNPAGNFAYISSFTSNLVFRCQVNPSTGALSACSSTGGGPGVFSQPIGIAFNTSGTIAYVTNSGTSKVLYCQVDPATGNLNSCLDAAPGVFPSPPQGVIIVDLPGGSTVAYVSDLIGTTRRCAINPGGDFGACTPVTPPLNDVVGVVLNVTRTFAYIASFNVNAVYFCHVNPVDGSFGVCNTTGGGGPPFIGPFGIAIL
jgi:hypothetical protein